MLSIFSKFNRPKQVQLPEACDVELPDASKAEEQFDSSPKRQLDGPFGPIPDVVTAIAEHLEPEHFTPAWVLTQNDAQSGRNAMKLPLVR